MVASGEFRVTTGSDVAAFSERAAVGTIGRPVAHPKPFVIAHLSDLHCGSPYFVENLLQRAIMEINALQPGAIRPGR